MIPLAHFIGALAQGELAVMLPTRLPALTGEDLVLERAAISAAEAAARLDAPGDPPPADPALSRWAWRVLYHAAALVVHRALGEDEIVARLGEAPPPVSDPAQAAWTVDVAFRHLAHLHRIAATVSAGDPLALALRELGAAWPLSGVGFAVAAKADDPRLAAILNHAALRRLYVDRVLATPDRERLAQPQVAAAARAALGGHAAMLPRVVAALAPALPAAPVLIESSAGTPP